VVPAAGALTGARPPGCAGGTGAAARCWPVTGPGARGRPEVLRLFDPPPLPWAAGHRGVDLRAGPGAPVRAAAPGAVVFAGAVGGVPVLVLRLAGGLRVTYEPVRASVPLGARVTAGARVGTLYGSVPHCPGSCLHWGLLAGTVYLDPLSLLPAALRRSGPSRLLPLTGG
jgi:murein DD-endopeptidase MepM/ murein hydrolase activator NlpD